MGLGGAEPVAVVTVFQRRCPGMDLRIPAVALAGCAGSEKWRTPLIPERVPATAGAGDDALTARAVTAIPVPAL